MFGRTTLCKSLLVTAISLALALSEVESAQETKAQQTADDYGSRVPIFAETARVATYNTCSERTASNHNHRDLMIVSTLDGKVSALDLHNAGSVQWTLDTDIGPLMDSSISKLEIIGPDGSYKVIPSLDGGLFRWDGQNVEPVPLNADILLSSSFKLSSDAMMVGGKETSTYGINAGTGQIVYICGENGCHMFEENQSTDKDDIIVIQRIQRICRAVDQRTGAEKWNFSVGQHEVSFLPGSHDDDDNHSMDDYDEDYSGSVCIEEMDEERAKIKDLLHPVFKVFISPGTVLAFSENDPTRLLWKQEFSTAIAAVWTIQEGKLKPLDLFDTNNIPLLGADGKIHPSSEFVHPVLYMGEYNEQAYVHPSKDLQQSVNEVTAAAAAGTAGQSSSTQGTDGALSIPKVQWRPYISTAPSRTPIVSNTKRTQWAVDAGSITVWSQYPFDLGYYSLDHSSSQFHVIGPNKNPLFIDSNDSGKSDDHEGLEILLSVSAAFWWKEILAISLVLAVGMQFMCHMFRSTSSLERLDSFSIVRVSTQDSMSEETSGNSENQSKEFKSRYLTDFEHQQCLGKGGFGIVFEAKNVVDENSYAIKRICLPNRTQARKKVLREARILARLDHSGIVRYFNSWLEEPPAGWQRVKDEHLLGDSVNPSHATLLSHSTTANFNKDSLLVRDKEQFLIQTSSHLSIPLTGQDGDSGRDFYNRIESDDFLGGAGYLSNVHDESGSFSVDGSFSVEFRDDEDGDAEPKVDDSDFGRSSDSDLLTPVNAPLCAPFGRHASIAVSHRAPDREDSDSLQVVFEMGSTDGATSKSGHTNSCNVNMNHCNPQSSTSDLGHELSKISDKHSKEGTADTTPCQAVPKVYLYIQMQLCQKETLKDWLGANTLSRDRVKLLHIFQQILGAVQYVHSCGMIHRDLKPSNIFFSAEGTVKVGDFGLVTAVDTQLEITDTLDDDFSSIDSSKKHTSQVGTQLYMSPEQLSGKSYDHKVDMFSLGLIFFELLHPFSTQMERIMVMTGARQQSFPDRFAKELPKETELIKWLLSSTPMERPDTNDITESTIFKRLYRDFVPPSTNRGRYASNSSN